MSGYTLERKIQCIRREIRQRKRVYKNLVGAKRMNPKTAAEEIGIMEEILADYEFTAEVRLLF